jgi:RNA polymerase sigma-70 factor, ECF subfamily
LYVESVEEQSGRFQTTLKKPGQIQAKFNPNSIQGVNGIEEQVMGTELTTLSDVALVAAIASGDERALSEAFRRHATAVSGLARRILGDENRAEDVCQDVFVKLWQEPNRFDGTRGSLQTLLLTQAHGRSVDMIRSHTARVQREEKVSRDHNPFAPDVDAEMMSLIDVQRVAAAMSQITIAEREAIELAYFQGHTYRQVATLLDVPEGTIKTRIRSGLRRLHALLNGDESLASLVNATPATPSTRETPATSATSATRETTETTVKNTTPTTQAAEAEPGTPQ